MAAVALSFPRHRFDRFDHFITSQNTRLNMDPSEASVHLVPNPDFVFPAPTHATNTPPPPKRPVSMHLNTNPPSRQRTHQRQSVSTLPTFTFNATDTSGFAQSSSPLPSPSSTVPTTPSRNMGHRRRASEFVGGDSRFGVSTLVSTSPSKPSESLLNPFESLSPPSEFLSPPSESLSPPSESLSPPSESLSRPEEPAATGSPSRRRGHAHRRSAAMSGHDLASILQPRDVNVAPQAPVPQLPIKELARTPSPRALSKESLPEDVVLASGPESSSRSSPTRPSTAHPSTRPRVGFSENVEYIPRPLSTISSESTSSASTRQGHSVTNSLNSISSVISLGGLGVPSPRRSFTPPTMDLHPGVKSEDISSLDSSPFPEPQVDVRTSPDKQSFPESVEAASNPSIKFDAPDGALPPSKKRLKGTLDRRRSEPLILAGALEQPGLSTVSLHEPVMSGPFQDCQTVDCGLNRKSSRRKVKDWANAFLGRKAKDPRKTRSVTIHTSPQTPSEPDTPTTQPDTPTTLPEVSPEAEPDLDAVFGQDPFSPTDNVSGFTFPPIQPKPDLEMIYPPTSKSEENEDSSHVIDLDAALGPYGTPSMSGGRRQMHSGGFGKRGLDHGHNRSCSLPALAPFQFDRPSSPARPSMADVFEEEEDDEVVSAEKKTLSGSSASEEVESDDEIGTGIEVVDAVAENEEPTLGRNAEHGLGIQGHDALPNRSLSVSLLRSSSPTGMRRTSVVDDTIVEEASPVDIVGDYEEPRTSSVTKSSDSSEASTVMADQRELGIPASTAEQSPTSPPTSYSTSTFSTPDYQHQQQFFDPSRLGTSASSIADNHTVSSCTTGEQGVDMHMSVDDVPSLTSSRSTMISAMQHSAPRRDYSDPSDSSDPSGSVISVPAEVEMSERRRKRSSIHSLSKLVGAPFGDGKVRSSTDQRPQTAVGITNHNHEGKKRTEKRLSKLMFWRSKSNSKSFSTSK